MDASVPVTFHPAGVTVDVPPGTTVLEAARRAGYPLAATCGGRGTCGDCAVRVLSGSLASPSEAEVASLSNAPADVRLACMARVESEVTIKPLSKLAASGAVVPSASSGTEAVAAVDLGTTSVSALVLERSGGRRIGQATVPNRQRAYAGDVAGRISAALAGQAGELREMAARTIGDALVAAAGGADIGRVVVAGNTAMTHLAFGADSAGLASHPYEGSLRGTVRTSAGALGLEAAAPATPVVFLPPMASFVGGDVTAGVLALGLDRIADTRVLLDLGTNAEVVVSRAGALTVASAAAGPAFEAAGLACGGMAVEGAVSDVRIEDDAFSAEVLGGGPATALCGSGALALVVALREAGHLDPGGRMHESGPLARRFNRRGDVLAFQVAGEPGASEDIYLTQLDVRALQLAKAAVATALAFTLRDAVVAWTDVAEVYVAGAFGAGVDAALLRRLGVLPAELGAPVAAVGNSSLSGAALVARDPDLETRAEAVATGARHVDLAGDSGFQQAFLANTVIG